MTVEPCRIGVDVGGTKIAVGVVDADGRTRHRRSVRTPRTGGDDVMTAVVDLVQGLMAHERGRSVPVGVGVGAPGTINPVTGTVLSATAVLPGWQGTEVGGVLGAAVRLPVVVANDVHAAATGEWRFGAGRGFDRFLVVSLGTGVGGALILDGQLQRGRHGAAGSLAHLLVPGRGAIACGCGRFDHLEAHASGPAIAAAYGAQVRERRPLGLPEVVERWRSGDGRAGGAVTSAAVYVGRAVAGLVSAVDVDAVVLTGGVAGIGSDLLVPMADAYRTSVMPAMREMPVMLGTLGTDAPLVGAASLVATESETSSPRGATT